MNASPERMSAEERREQILRAATVVFGERGYVGGTTDQIARQAGISQAYVVRMFGSKEQLFSAVGDYAAGRVADAFREAITTFPEGAGPVERQTILGDAYAKLLADRGLLLSLLQLFSQGHDPVFGPQARGCFLDVYKVAADEAGLGTEAATQFFARGMLLTILMAMRMPDAVATDPDAAEMLGAAAGNVGPTFIDLATSHLPLPDVRR